jgi:stage II sporulation protein D
MQRKRLIILVFILLLVSLPESGWSAASKEESIRILIGKYKKDFSVSGTGIKLRAVNEGKESLYNFKQNILTIQKKGNGIKANKSYVRGQQFQLSSTDGELAINGTPYGGTVIIESNDDQELLLINEVALERYLEGLISIELSPRWDITTMKVQAVVARTYSLFQKSLNNNKSYHLTSSVLHQLYRGISHANNNTRRAVKETRGEILTWNDLPIMAVYHSCCGGSTESSANVWGTYKPYLEGVFCGMCTNYDGYFWKLVIPRGTFFKQLCKEGFSVCNDVASTVNVTRSSNNRVIQLALNGNRKPTVITGNELRSVFGFSKIRSTSFIIKETDDGYFHLLGTGNGHGVGLCQWGARARARSGETYYKILQHYYPGTQIKRAY